MKTSFAVTASFKAGDSCCTFRWATDEGECEREFRAHRPDTVSFRCEMRPNWQALNTDKIRKELIGQCGLLDDVVRADHPHLAEITKLLFNLAQGLTAVDNLLKKV